MSYGCNNDDLQGRALKRRKLYYPLSMAQSERSNSPPKSPGTPLQNTSDVVSEQCSAANRTGDREDLIARLKRGERPTWIPSSSMQTSNAEARSTALNSSVLPSETLSDINLKPRILYPTSQGASVDHSQREGNKTPQRARSALHRGDFADNSPGLHYENRLDDLFQRVSVLSNSTDFGLTPRQWLANSLLDPPSPETRHDSRSVISEAHARTRRRAPSLGTGLSSSYVFRAPTSPLVQASTHSYLDLPNGHDSAGHFHASGDSSRRRTMPPSSLNSFSAKVSEPTTPNFSRPLSASLRREASMPIHTHRPRPSLSSLTYQPISNPQPLSSRSRRPSQASDTASRRRKSMVVSFEESLLRGTMSTPASKPLEFVAQIGVMGKGECPASLKCPAHVTVSFPAVFYSYPAVTGSRSISDDTPSPYVGRIDLEQNLKSVTLGASKTRRSYDHDHHIKYDETKEKATDAMIRLGGAYRVPKQGQLQIIIKNPNATAVKLFLVPYDLDGMPANTKTFVRQRSFSSGVIVEEAFGQTGTKVSTTDPFEAKTILRYLIHVKFCCPSKNRFYLYDDIRVVFANRVPDGKEKLRNEIQLPEPKFTSWKPDTIIPRHQSDRDAQETPGHLSSEVKLSPSSWTPYEVKEFYAGSPSLPRTLRRSPSPYIDSPPTRAGSSGTTTRVIDSSPIPLKFGDIQQGELGAGRSITPVKGFNALTSPHVSPLPWRQPSTEVEAPRNYAAVPPAPGSGLISQQFHELDQKKKKERQRMRDILSGESGSSEEASP